MPRCAIISCRNASGKVNFKNAGVSYHVFPKNPELKEKWIRSTGRQNWFPTKTSTVCSKHFIDYDFVVTPHKRCIKPSALPHIDVCIVSSFDTSPRKVENVSESALKQKQHIVEETITTSKKVLQEDQLFCAINCDHVALNDSPVHFDTSPIKVENVSGSSVKRKEHVVEDTITTTKTVRQEDQLFCAINCDRVALNDSPVHFDTSLIKVENVSESALKQKQHIVEETITTSKKVLQEDQLFCAINCDHVALNDTPVHFDTSPIKVENISGSSVKRKEHVVEDTITTTKTVRQEDQLFCAINCDRVALNDSPVHFDTSLIKVENVSESPLKRKQHTVEDTVTTSKRVLQEDQLFFAINCDRVALNDSVHFDTSLIKVENVSESPLKQKQHAVEDTFTTSKRVQEDPLFCAINCDRVALNDSPVHFDTSPIKVENVSGSSVKRKEHVVEDTITTTKTVRQEDQLFGAINCDRVALNDSPVHINKIVPSWSNASTPRRRKLNNIIKKHKQVIMKQIPVKKITSTKQKTQKKNHQNRGYSR